MTNEEAAEVLEAMPVAYALHLDEVRAIEAASTALRRDQWEPIESATLGETVLLWARGWRHPYIGVPNGSSGECWIDGVPNASKGWQTFAHFWMPLPSPPTEG